MPRSASKTSFDKAGNFYVSEFGENSRISKFDTEGAFVKCWGSPGIEPGQFQRIRAMTLGPDGNLYVACYASDEIWRISPAGEKQLLAWDHHAILLSRPTNIAFGGPDLKTAYERAFQCDPVSPFGGVVAVSFIVSLFPIITNATAGLTMVDVNLLELFEINNASQREQAPGQRPVIGADVDDRGGGAGAHSAAGSFDPPDESDGSREEGRFRRDRYPPLDSAPGAIGVHHCRRENHAQERRLCVARGFWYLCGGQTRCAQWPQPPHRRCD